MIQFIKKISFISSVGILMLLSSCGYHKMDFIRDIQPNINYPIPPDAEIKIQTNDRLKIVVSSKSPELAIPFNNSGYISSSKGEIVQNQASSEERGYLVDNNGDIEFPIFGKIHAQGYTKTQLSEQIKKKLIDSGQINEPTVNVYLLNFRILVLGEVGRSGDNGTLSVQENNITLLEAIVRSGGVTNNAKMDKVEVIREVGGVRKMYQVDLRSVSLFDSPVYYLQQNDIVYVRPISPRTTQASENTWRIIGTLTSIPTLVISLLVLLK